MVASSRLYPNKCNFVMHGYALYFLTMSNLVAFVNVPVFLDFTFLKLLLSRAFSMSTRLIFVASCIFYC